MQVADTGTLLASFYVHPLLVDQIKEGQKQVSEMIRLRAEIEGGRKPKFRIRDDGVIVRGSRMCVPEIDELKREIMEEAHSSAYAMHPGSTKMYHTLREHYWWKGIEKGNCRFRIQMPNLSAGKGRAPEARMKDTAPSDSCMEVG